MSKEMKEMKEMYFKNIKVNDKVFGLIFGSGIVRSVWENSHYTFEVEYKNGQVVPYTSDGVPGWTGKFDYQTVFYKKDIDIMDLDMNPLEKILSPKKIIKLRDKGKLEMRCPSGIWTNSSKCPGYLFEEYAKKEQFHLFRRKKIKEM